MKKLIEIDLITGNEYMVDTHKMSDEQLDKLLEYQPLKANNKEYPIESMQELYRLASRGIK